MFANEFVFMCECCGNKGYVYMSRVVLLLRIFAVRVWVRFAHTREDERAAKDIVSRILSRQVGEVVYPVEAAAYPRLPSVPARARSVRYTRGLDETQELLLDLPQVPQHALLREGRLALYPV
jgi:hypothetical protein